MRLHLRERLAARVRAWLGVVTAGQLLEVHQRLAELSTIAYLRGRELELLLQKPTVDYKLLDAVRKELHEAQISYGRRHGGRA